jgi:hypothetical protein
MSESTSYVFILRSLDAEDASAQQVLRQRHGIGVIHALLTSLMATARRKPGDRISTAQIRQILEDSKIGGIAHSSHAIGDVLGKSGLALRWKRAPSGRGLLFELPEELPVVQGDSVIKEALYAVATPQVNGKHVRNGKK